MFEWPSPIRSNSSSPESPGRCSARYWSRLSRMISGGSSSCSASSRVATMSGAWTVKGVVELADMLDVGLVIGVVAGLRLEPAVEDFRQQRIGGAAQAEREHVCVVPGAGTAGGLGVGAQGSPDARDLVGRDRGA